MYTYDRVSGSPVRVIIKPFKIVIAAVMVNVIIIGLCYNNVKKNEYLVKSRSNHMEKGLLVH
jgi:hypothetical protein